MVTSSKLKFFMGVLSLWLSTPVFAQDCWLIQDGAKVLQETGACQQRQSPCSTFKIPLSLIGYQEGIFIDATHPAMPYKPEYNVTRAQCQSAQTPVSWIQNSCVWVSQQLTQQVGLPKLQDYLSHFQYGNQDLSGGLTEAWLSSGRSLKISPKEQITFLQKEILTCTTPACTQTRAILFIETLANGWQLYGKTGSGNQFHPDGTEDDRKIGWFVGWIEKGPQTLVFAQFIADPKKEDSHGGPRAKEIAKTKLTSYLK